MKHLNEEQTTRMVNDLILYLDETEPSHKAMARLIYGKETSKDYTKMQTKTIQTLSKWWVKGEMAKVALSVIVSRFTYTDSLTLTYKGISVRFKHLTPYPSTAFSGGNILHTIQTVREQKEKDRRLGRKPRIWDGTIKYHHEEMMCEED